MVDRNTANLSNTRVEWPRSSKPAPRPEPTKSSFSRFCWGTALGVVVGGFAGAFLPDRILGASPFGHADFGPVPAAHLTRENRTPTPLSQLSDIQATAEEPHTWDAD